jgi:putative transposase
MKLVSIRIIGAEPKIAPLRVISIIKSITARKIFEKFPKLKKEELWGGEFWSDGKYIGTVGEATSEKVIRKYIRNHSHNEKETESRLKQLKLFKM